MRKHRAAREELWGLRYLLLEAGPTLTERQRGDVEELLHTHWGTILAQACYCKEAIVILFRSSQTKEEARARRDMIVRRFGDVPELQEVINLIQGNEFEQMIGYLQRREKMRCPVHRARATSLLQTQSATVQSVHH